MTIEERKEAALQRAALRPEGVYERRQLERREASRPYVEFRQATIARLTAMWQTIGAFKGPIESLHKILRDWPDQFRKCEPPKELFEVPELHAENRRVLRMLSRGARRLAEVTTADLSPDVATANQEPALRFSATMRVAMFCRLAKALGMHQRGIPGLMVELDTSAISDDEMEMGSESLAEGLSEVLARNGIRSNLDDTDGVAVALGTRHTLKLEILQWQEGTQLGTGSLHFKSETRVQLSTAEPDPGEQEVHEKTVPYERLISKPLGAVSAVFEARQAWADHILDTFPQVNSLKHTAWVGIDITCPRCGHAHIVTARPTPLFNACLRCGHDAVTGLTQAILSKAKQAGSKKTNSALAIVASTIPIVGFWGYFTFTRHFGFWPFLLAHLVGIAGLVFSIRAYVLARGQHQEAMAEQNATAGDLKFPQAVAENQRQIQAEGIVAGDEK